MYLKNKRLARYSECVGVAFSATISGRVQMVLYRDFAKRKADELGLMGETENLDDGTVRVYAEGERGNLEAYLKELKQGPEHANVERVRVQWVEPKGSFTDFSIIYGR